MKLLKKPIAQAIYWKYITTNISIYWQYIAQSMYWQNQINCHQYFNILLDQYFGKILPPIFQYIARSIYWQSNDNNISIYWQYGGYGEMAQKVIEGRQVT